MSRLHPDVRVWLNHQLNLTLDELNQGGVAAETSHIETALYYGWRRHPQPEDRWLWKNIVLGLGPPSSVTPRPARQPSTDHREKRQRIDTTPPPPVTLLPNQAAASQPSPEQSLDYNRTISNDSAPTLPGQDDTSPEPSSAAERDNSPEPENYTPPDVGS